MSKEDRGRGRRTTDEHEYKRSGKPVGEVFVLVPEGDGSDWAIAGDAGGSLHHDHDATEEWQGTVRAAEDPGRG